MPAKLAGDLTVRLARPGETIAGPQRPGLCARPEHDGRSPTTRGVQSIGGVIGGEATGCTETTTEVFLEVALFDPIRTAATGRKLGIESDARYRFERGLDPACRPNGGPRSPRG